MKKLPVSTAVDYRLSRPYFHLMGMESFSSVLPHGVCPNAVRIVTSTTTDYQQLHINTLKVSNQIWDKLGESPHPMVCDMSIMKDGVKGIWLQPEYQDLSTRDWVRNASMLKVASLHGYTVVDFDVTSLKCDKRLLLLNALNAAAPIITDWVFVEYLGQAKYRHNNCGWYRCWPWLTSLEREVSPWGWQWQKNYGEYERQVLLWDGFSNPKHKLARFSRRDPFASLVCHPAQLHDWSGQVILRFWPLPALLPTKLPLVVGEVVNWLQDCLKADHESAESLPLFKGRAVPKSLSEWLYLWQKY